MADMLSVGSSSLRPLGHKFKGDREVSHRTGFQLQHY